MKVNLDDPNLTAFALGELSDAERAAMEKMIAASPEAQDAARFFAGIEWPHPEPPPPNAPKAPSAPEN